LTLAFRALLPLPTAALSHVASLFFFSFANFFLFDTDFAADTTGRVVLPMIVFA
jgi:hypothetical protein